MGISSLFLADFVNQILKERGLDQYELALLIGVEKSSVNKWSLGKAFPSDQQIEKLVRFSCVNNQKAKVEELSAAREIIKFQNTVKRKGLSMHTIQKLIAA